MPLYVLRGSGPVCLWNCWWHWLFVKIVCVYFLAYLKVQHWKFCILLTSPLLSAIGGTVPVIGSVTNLHRVETVFLSVSKQVYKNHSVMVWMWSSLQDHSSLILMLIIMLIIRLQSVSDGYYQLFELHYHHHLWYKSVLLLYCVVHSCVRFVSHVL